MAHFRLIVGLGNVGRQYAATRHNAGFWFVDRLAERLGATFSAESKFAGELARAGDLRLLKPGTYMNLSGRSVAATARFFDIAADEILVAHDELDLLPGIVRLKQGGGHAGHNGLRDIHAHLGAQFWRLRLGIGHPRDSETPQQDVADYVLKPPRADEKQAIDEAIARSLVVWPLLARGETAQATMQLHTDGNVKRSSVGDVAPKNGPLPSNSSKELP